MRKPHCIFGYSSFEAPADEEGQEDILRGQIQWTLSEMHKIEDRYNHDEPVFDKDYAQLNRDLHEFEAQLESLMDCDED